MKKLFGGINLTWKKLILFAVGTAIYTAVMALIPITKDTSFRDIATYMEWWIFFGIIIISNSKSPKDSALKCFIFFLISQPLIYLIQVPFIDIGFGIFTYYKTWFILTLLTLPMGFIGYYIKKKNIISMIILLPMLLFLAYLGLGYLSATMETFPHHLLSCIACFLMIIIIIFNLFDKLVYKLISLFIVVAAASVYLFFNNGVSAKYEAYKTLDSYDIKFTGKIMVSDYTGTAQGNVIVTSSDDSMHTVKLIGRKNGKYEFTLRDEANNLYTFEYYFDNDSNTVILNRKN